MNDAEPEPAISLPVLLDRIERLDDPPHSVFDQHNRLAVTPSGRVVRMSYRRPLDRF